MAGGNRATNILPPKMIQGARFGSGGEGAVQLKTAPTFA